MTIKAVQQFQLGTVLNNEAQARNTLKLMKQAGYDGIELCGFMIRKMPFTVKLLMKFAGMPVGKSAGLNWNQLVKEADLKVLSIHQDLGTIQKEIDYVIQQAKSFDTKYVVVTGMYRFDYSDEQAILKLAVDLNEAGEKLLEADLHLLYHNHNCELRKVSENKTAFELLIEKTDERYVNFEFDSYWPTEAGANALALMKSLGNRMKLYHINDRGTRLQGSAMTPILKSDSMELGYGNMDLTSLVEQAESVGVDAIILETHKNWVDKSPIKSFELSSHFLNKIID